MKKVCVVLALILPFLSISQDTWFRLYDYGTDGQASVLIDALGNDYILFCFGANYFSGDVTANGIVRTDRELDEKWKTRLRYPPEALADQVFYYPKGMVISKDSSIYALSSMHSEPVTLPSKKVLLNKIDKNGVWQWYKILSYDSLGLEGGIFGIALSPDSLGAMVVGRSVYPDASAYVLFRADEYGKILLRKKIDIPWLGRRYMAPELPIVLMKDGKVALALTDEGSPDASYDYVLKVDTLGNVLNMFVNIDSTDGFVGDLAAHPNGNVVYLSARTYVWLPQWGDPVREGMRTQMLSPDLEVLWEDLYYDFNEPGFVFGTSTIKKVEIFPNGNILTFAFHGPNATLICYTPTGERLWVREICLREVGLQLKYESIGITGEGNILVSGYLYNLPGDNRRIFVMRLDSVGCLTPGCDTTYFEPLTVFVGNKEIFPLYGQIELSPNPSFGLFRLNLIGNNIENIQGCQVRIYDPKGSLIAENPFYSNIEIAELTGKESGIYYVSIVKNNQILWSEQIVHINK